MSDTLIVGGGGELTVASEDLLVAADRAEVLAAEADEIADELMAAASSGALLPRALDARDVADRLRATALMLRLALDAYSAAERAATGAATAAAGELAYWAGVLAPLALALIPVPVLIGVVGWLAGGAIGAKELFERQRGHLSDVRLVAALRVASAVVDDAARGAARLPWVVSALADDRATGALGREAAARLLLGALPGPVPSGPLLLSAAPGRVVPAPRSLEDLGTRIPPPAEGGPQLIIERYETPSGPLFALYIGGTVDLSGEAGAEPWDLASSAAAMAGVASHSEAAAAAALRASGAAPSDRVLLVGYSQGGLVASRLAESGEFHVAGVVTVGSPGRAIPSPEGVPVLALEHAEDLVPALAGPFAARSPVVVTRSLYDGRPPVTPRAVPAHELAEYRATLALADRSEERRVARVRGELLSLFPPTASGRATPWRAERAE